MVSKIVNLSFSGAGFLGIYQLGAAAALRETFGPRMREERVASFIGTSFGSVAATLLACELDPRLYAPVFIEAARDTRRRPLRSFTPGFYAVQYLYDAMHAELPEDAHERCNGRLLVSLSVRTHGGRAPFVNRLVSYYPSRAYLADALSAACWIPGVTGGLLSLPRLGEDTVMDGTLTATLAPSHPSNTLPTVFVSPFSNGRFNICPQHTGSHYKIKIPTGREFNISTWNLTALGKAVWTPSDTDLDRFFQLGHDDTMRYFEQQQQQKQQQHHHQQDDKHHGHESHHHPQDRHRQGATPHS